MIKHIKNYFIYMTILLLLIVHDVYSQTGPLNGNGGGIIAFTSDRDGNFEIYLMNADGTAQTRITNSNALDFDASWSRDGSQLAFISTRDSGFEIYIMTVIDITNGIFTDPERITFEPSMETKVTWLHDGSKIAYNTSISGQYGVYIHDLISNQIEPLNTSSIEANQPCWSPDGTKIVFGNSDGIYSINIDGTSLQQLTATGNSLFPVWSPNGDKIAFVAGTPDEDIYLVNSDGTSLINLTASTANDFVPSWSPDGSGIVYEDDRYGHDEICLIDRFGGNHQRLTSIGANTGPAWRPNANVTLVEEDSPNWIPQRFELLQNFPNPFNPTTNIHYTLSEPCYIKLVIYNSLGHEIKILVDEFQTEGYKTIKWDGRNNKGNQVCSGIYFYRLGIDRFEQIKKMILLR